MQLYKNKQNNKDFFSSQNKKAKPFDYLMKVPLKVPFREGYHHRLLPNTIYKSIFIHKKTSWDLKYGVLLVPAKN